MKEKILVWDWPTRVFHWSLAASFLTAYVTAESERFREVHVLSGYLLIALIVFRVAWGLVGSRYARFGNFIKGSSAVVSYLRSLLGTQAEHHVGHNPAGAVAIVLLLLLGLGTALTGWLHFNEVGGEVFEEVHEVLANTMLAVVIVHIAGVFVSSFLHRENLASSMVSGYKQGEAAERIPRGHGMIALILAAALAVFGWSLAQGVFPALWDTNAASSTSGTAKHGEHHHDKDGDHD